MKFNEKIQQLRKERGMSQENLAELLNVSRQSVSKWENGTAYPETEKIIVMSELFGISVDHLLKDQPLVQTPENDKNVEAWHKIRNHYEYKSKRTFFGVPLVHINIGRRDSRAKGIIAIGNIATGVISFGFVSIGFISSGFVSLSLLGLSIVNFGLLFSGGIVAIGFFSFGVVSIGVLSIGAIAIGMFAYGPIAVATHIAIGHVARGFIAIGHDVIGKHTFSVSHFNDAFNEINLSNLNHVISSSFSGLVKTWANFFISLFH